MAAAEKSAGATAVAAVIEGVRQAAAGYAASFNAGDEKALAAQWTAGAELQEGGAALKGRTAIVRSLMEWRRAHPDATLGIEVTDVHPLGENVARVGGTLTFTSRTGGEPLTSRFESLRVREDGVWRLATSRVVPDPETALAGLSWLIGTWRAADAKAGSTVDATYERSLDGHAIVGRIKTTHKDGSVVEAIDLIHFDRVAGVVRSTVVDSTGAHAEGTFTSDGTSFNRRFVGTPGDIVRGDRAEWVQVLAPLAADKVVWHSIERRVDGRTVPDTEPVHLQRVR